MVGVAVSDMGFSLGNVNTDINNIGFLLKRTLLNSLFNDNEYVALGKATMPMEALFKTNILEDRFLCPVNANI